LKTIFPDGKIGVKTIFARFYEDLRAFLTRKTGVCQYIDGGVLQNRGIRRLNVRDRYNALMK